MNLIPTLRWIVDEWLSNFKIHGILQNVIQVPTWHPRPLLVEDKPSWKKNPLNCKLNNQ